MADRGTTDLSRRELLRLGAAGSLLLAGGTGRPRLCGPRAAGGTTGAA